MRENAELNEKKICLISDHNTMAFLHKVEKGWLHFLCVANGKEMRTYVKSMV